MFLVGASGMVAGVLSSGLRVSDGVLDIAIPCIFCLILGVAVIKVGLRPKDSPDESDNSSPPKVDRSREEVNPPEN
jgi:hypothetical protein